MEEKVETSDLQKSDLILLLVDSSSQINDIKEIYNIGKKAVIISFDYDSHKILSSNVIEHEISDNYLSEGDLQTIQKNSYILSKWFEEPKISKIIQYCGINLGQLLHTEFSFLLIKFLKEFLELNGILKKYPNTKIVASSILYNVVKTMTINVTKLGSQNALPTFQFDYIKHSFKILNHSYTFTIPRNYYTRLKKISEKILPILLESDKNITSSSKSILLVEFDQIRFKSLFSEMSKTPLNFMLYNRRRPTIWNFESFKVIRNAKCKIVNINSLEDTNVKSRIKRGIPIVHSMVTSLLNEEDYLRKFFSIYGISFWNAIKSLFIDLFFKRVEGFVTEIEAAKQLLIKYAFSCIVVWSEVGSTEQILIKFAKECDIPIVLIQHGIFYDTEEAYDMNVFQGVFPTTVDKYVVWGKIEAEHAIKHGVKPEKIETLGSPQYDSIGTSRIESPTKGFILVATSGSNKEEVRGLTVKFSKQEEETILQICKIASHMNKKLVIKLHPSQDEKDFSEFTAKIDPTIVVLRAGSISPLIRDCDVLIMIDLTSVVIEAQLQAKPVIYIPIKNWWGIPEAFRSNSCLKTDIDDLENILNKILTDGKFRDQLIQRGTMFVNRYVTNRGTASKKILELISRVHHENNS